MAMSYTLPAYSTLYPPASTPTSSYNWEPVTFSTSSTPTLNHEQATISSGSYKPTPTVGIVGNIIDGGNGNFWQNLAHGAKIGIVLVVIIGIFCVVLFSMWFCCGCCGGRCCGKRKRIPREENRGDLPLNTIPDPERRGRPDDRAVYGDPPPPQYEEALPPQHQTIAGGITHVREEEEGVISDGKTPLSEIPFEDVVLDRPGGSGSGSPSSAREFARHHELGGDTRGHTNS